MELLKGMELLREMELLGELILVSEMGIWSKKSLRVAEYEQAAANAQILEDDTKPVCSRYKTIPLRADQIRDFGCPKRFQRGDSGMRSHIATTAQHSASPADNPFQQER